MRSASARRRRLVSLVPIVVVSMRAWPSWCCTADTERPTTDTAAAVSDVTEDAK